MKKPIFLSFADLLQKMLKIVHGLCVQKILELRRETFFSFSTHDTMKFCLLRLKKNTSEIRKNPKRGKNASKPVFGCFFLSFSCSKNPGAQERNFFQLFNTEYGQTLSVAFEKKYDQN